MSRADDKRIAALARKNAAKINPTLRQRPGEQSPETQRLFKEMKRREF